MAGPSGTAGRLLNCIESFNLVISRRWRLKTLQLEWLSSRTKLSKILYRNQTPWARSSRGYHCNCRFAAHDQALLLQKTPVSTTWSGSSSSWLGCIQNRASNGPGKCGFRSSDASVPKVTRKAGWNECWVLVNLHLPQ